MADRYEQEAFGEFLRSRNFRAFYEISLRPQVRVWKRELLTNLAMDEAHRRGYQIALAALQEGISSSFEKSGLQLPPWLAEELSVENEHDR